MRLRGRGAPPAVLAVIATFYRLVACDVGASGRIPASGAPGWVPASGALGRVPASGARVVASIDHRGSALFQVKTSRETRANVVHNARRGRSIRRKRRRARHEVPWGEAVAGRPAISRATGLQLPNSSAAPGTRNCAAHYTDWSKCEKNCVMWRSYEIDAPAQEGGEPCEHTNHFIDRKACTGGACPHEELAPTGDLPGGEKPEMGVYKLAVGVELPFAIAVMLSLMVAEVFHKYKKLGFLPHSLIVVVMSALLGVGLRLAGGERWEAEQFSPVSSSVMNLVLLPIILFQSGWVLHVGHFWDHFGYILVLAVLGTAVSTFAVAGLIIYTGELGWHVVTGTREAFALASLISATDPVATLATFAEKRVEAPLSILVFGESTINDAVAIAFFNLLNHDEVTAFFDPRRTCGRAAALLVGSVTLGFLVGAVVTRLYGWIRRLGPNTAEFSVLFIFSSAYLTNAVAECAHCSGIIACLFSGITMGVYLKPHLGSEEVEQQTDSYLESAAKMADLTVFVMVGITTSLINSNRGTKFGILLFVFCLIGRAASVGLCAGLCNMVRKLRGEDPLFTKRRTTMLWHAGLRGGIALTLVLELNDWAAHKAVLVTATFITITLLLLVLGSSTDTMLHALQIPTGMIQRKVSYIDRHDWASHHDPLDNCLLRSTKAIHSGLHYLLVGDDALKQAPGEKVVAVVS